MEERLGWHQNLGYPAIPQDASKKKKQTPFSPTNLRPTPSSWLNQTPMLAHSRNTTEQRYQTNALEPEINPGSLFSAKLKVFRLQQERLVKLESTFPSPSLRQPHGLGDGFQLTWALGEGSGEPAPPILSHPHCWSSVCSGFYGSLSFGQDGLYPRLRTAKERQGTPRNFSSKPTEEPRQRYPTPCKLGARPSL